VFNHIGFFSFPVVHAFASGTMVQVFQLAQGILADTWSGKDRGAK